VPRDHPRLLASKRVHSIPEPIELRLEVWGAGSSLNLCYDGTDALGIIRPVPEHDEVGRGSLDEPRTLSRRDRQATPLAMSAFRDLR